MIDVLALLAGFAVGVLAALAIAGLAGGKSPVRVPGPARAPAPSPAPQPPQQAAAPPPAIRVNRPSPGAPPADAPAPSPAARPPSGPVRARLTPSDGSDSVDLGDEVVTMGRGTDQRLRIPDSRASRAHAIVRPRAKGGWELKDMGSANGTQLNGHAIPEGRVAPLRDGDRIGIGPVTITYSERSGGSPPPDPGPAPDPDATRIL